MDEQKVVNQETPDQSPLAEAIASSPEVVEEAKQAQPETETATPTEQAIQEPVEQEEGKIPYSRFKEKVDETNWYKQQLEQLIQTRQQQLNVQQPTQDPYAGMTAEEARFWQGIDKRIEDRANVIADTKIRQISPVIDAGRMELAQIKVSQFRAQHPDIKANSPEEMEIAQRIQQGYTPDDAYWATMGPRGRQVVEKQVKQQVKQQIVAKKMANVETSSSVPIHSPSENLPIPKTRAEREEQTRSRAQKFRDDFLKRWNDSEKA